MVLADVRQVWGVPTPVPIKTATPQLDAPRFESDSESTLHPVVVAHHQPCQRLRGLPGWAEFW